MSLKALNVLRPKQWVKNFLIFTALIFSQNFFEPEKFLATTYAFLIFCGLASAAYVLNFFYSFLLKNIVIVDVLVLAAFYVIRVWAGAIAIEVAPTPWLMIAALLLALFLGFGKRRHELTQLGEDASSHRSILKEYSPYYLDQMIAVVTSSTIIVYIFYTLDETVQANMETDLLPVTIPFVLYGIFRYLYLIHQKHRGGSPTQTIITDAPLLINVGLWVVLVLYLIS